MNAGSNDQPGGQGPLLYTEREAAKLLSVSTRTLFTMRKAKRIRHVIVGTGGVRYSVANIEEFILKQTRGD